MKKIIIGIVILVIICVIGLLIYKKYNKKEEEIIIKPQEAVKTIKIIVNNNELIVNLEDNLSAQALVEKLESGDITVEAHDFGNFEKVGDLGFNITRSDKYIKTGPGDVILYNGNQICLYYDENTWNFTRIGKIDISQEELKNILGEGDVTFIITK